jgi:hypothetical protein
MKNNLEMSTTPVQPKVDRPADRGSSLDTETVFIDV